MNIYSDVHHGANKAGDDLKVSTLGLITQARAKMIQPTLETLLGFRMTFPEGPETEVISSGSLEACALAEHEFAHFTKLMCMEKCDEFLYSCLWLT